MIKDILLFGSIWQYSAMYFFEQITEALKDNPESELTLRINCEGGSPEYGMGIIEKVQELAGQISIKVSGMAHSMALFLLCYVDKDKIEVLDTTQSVLHRASFGEWIESQSWFPESVLAELMARSNKDLEKAFRARVDVEALENLPQFKSKSITLKDIFDPKRRIEVMLTGSDLKKIGLVGSVNRVTPSKSAQLKSELDRFSKCRSLEEFRLAAQAPVPKIETENPTTMTLAELKAQFPGVYNEALALGVAEGIAKEKDRCEACLVYLEIDPKTVKEAIESGKPFSQKQMAELNLKASNPELLKKMAAESTKKVETEAPAGEKTEKEKKIEEEEKKLFATLGIGKGEKKELNYMKRAE